MIDVNMDEAVNVNVVVCLLGWLVRGSDRMGTGTRHPSSTRDEKFGLGLDVVRCAWVDVGGCGR
jgi:hypothetical protein